MDAGLEVVKLQTGDLQTNTYIVWKGKNAVVIDPGDNDPRIESILDSYELILRGVLLTHAHGDHIGGVPELQKKCPVFLHKMDREILADPGLNLSMWAGLGPIQGLQADRFVIDNEEIDLFGVRVKVIHTPGHTPGSVCYALEDLLFTGDTLFKGSIGRTDLPGGSTEAIKHSLKVFSQLRPTLRVLPGHGPETTLSLELAQNPFLREG